MSNQWDATVMIPVCREAELLPGCIASLSQLPQAPLIVLVLNERENAEARTTIENNQLRDWLHQFSMKDKHRRDPIFDADGVDVLLLDYAQGASRLRPKQGVGYARHVGMNRCCELIAEGRIKSPWIRSTDADARFSLDYLNPIAKDSGVCIFPYWHHPAELSLQIYDIGLRYFALGLNWAKTPYAFPTLGSVIAIHADLYAQIGGFPDRMAGEDFYLLNKASKIDVLEYLDRDPVRLVGRPSDRVPFGTGRGMMQIASSEKPHCFYSPKAFTLLKRWVEVLNNSSDTNLLGDLEALAPGFPGLKKMAKLLRQPVKGVQVFKRRHAFFDAFWIMKLMHYLRDSSCPSVPWREALAQAPFVSCAADAPEEIKRQLELNERMVLSGRHFGLKAMDFSLTTKSD